MPEPMNARIIRGREGWWVLLNGRAALLPAEGVSEGPPEASVPGRVWDRERGRSLTEPAITALQQSQFLRERERASNFAITVLTATSCNLGCDYCFQNTSTAPAGSHAPPRIRRAVLDPDGVHAVCAFVARQQKTSNLESVSLLIFGGEPLLNYEGSLRLLRGLAPLNLVDSEIVTNGVLLTRKRARELAAMGLRRVQITFDGPRRHHDQIRVLRNGGPTYDTILRNVARAIEVAPQLAWNFRVNVSHHNIDGIDELIEDLVAIRTDATAATLHLAMIDDTGLGYQNELRFDGPVAQAFVEANRRAIGAGIRVIPSMSLRECPYCSVAGGARGAVVNADGDLYSCWENAGRSGWAVGSVVDGYTSDSSLQEKWVACDFEIKPHGSVEATRQFLDYVDAAALDDQFAAGMLASSRG
jgi:uncharacterized protein